MGELLARLRSLTRRQEDFNRDTLQAGTVTLNCAEGELSSKSSVRLSPKETQLMKYFMQHPGKPCETRMLFDRIWQDEQQEDQGIVWIYVSYLREKLKAIGAISPSTATRTDLLCSRRRPWPIKENLSWI